MLPSGAESYELFPRQSAVVSAPPAVRKSYATLTAEGADSTAEEVESRTAAEKVCSHPGKALGKVLP